MKYIKDKKIFILIAILLLFTISYFLIVNKVSYAFDEEYDLKFAYDKQIEIIKKCAKDYAKKHNNEFNEEGIIYIDVQKLIDEKYLMPSKNGKINNPLKVNEDINKNKIRIKKDKNKLKVSIYD